MSRRQSSPARPGAVGLMLLALMGCQGTPPPRTVFPTDGGAMVEEGPGVRISRDEAVPPQWLKIRIDAPQSWALVSLDGLDAGPRTRVRIRGMLDGKPHSRLRIEPRSDAHAPGRAIEEVEIGPVRRRGSFEVEAPLAPGHWDRLALGLTSPATVVVEEIAIVTVPTRAAQALASVRDRGSNVWLLVGLALAILLAAGTKAAARLRGRAPPAIVSGHRLLTTLVGATLLVWGLQSVASEKRIIAGLYQHLNPPPARTRHRLLASAEASRELAWLIEHTVPPDSRVGLSPSSRTMGTYHLQNTIMPRVIVHTPCRDWDEGELPAFVAARMGCFQQELRVAPLRSESTGSRLEIEAADRTRWLRQLAVDPKSPPPPGSKITLIDAEGTALWGAALTADERTPLPLIEIPAGRAFAIVTTSPVSSLRVFGTPTGWMPRQANDWGDVVLARPGAPEEPIVSFLAREEEEPGPGELARLVLALSLAVLAGRGILSLLVRASPAGAAATLAYSWLLGIGLASTLLHTAAWWASTGSGPRWRVSWRRPRSDPGAGDGSGRDRGP